jgi:hypothetical protein
VTARDDRGVLIELIHPEFSQDAPSEYDLDDVVIFQNASLGFLNSVYGEEIYERLLSMGLIKACLHFQDGLIIKRKGVEVYRQIFGERILCLWGSLRSTFPKGVCVLCLHPEAHEIKLKWRPIQIHRWPPGTFDIVCYPGTKIPN